MNWLMRIRLFTRADTCRFNPDPEATTNACNSFHRLASSHVLLILICKLKLLSRVMASLTHFAVSSESCVASSVLENCGSYDLISIILAMWHLREPEKSCKASLP